VTDKFLAEFQLLKHSLMTNNC